MKIRWANQATADLARLFEHLRPVAPKAAARVAQQLTDAPGRLIEHPRLGEKLQAYEPREVRRLFLGSYEIRYEIAAGTIFVLRIWHGRESRGVEAEE